MTCCHHYDFIDGNEHIFAVDPSTIRFGPGALAEMGYEVLDLGTDGPQSVDYPDFGAALAKAVGAGDVERGILICGTGIGISMAANRHPGVRAASGLRG